MIPVPWACLWQYVLFILIYPTLPPLPLFWDKMPLMLMEKRRIKTHKAAFCSNNSCNVDLMNRDWLRGVWCVRLRVRKRKLVAAWCTFSVLLWICASNVSEWPAGFMPYLWNIAETAAYVEWQLHLRGTLMKAVSLSKKTDFILDWPSVTLMRCFLNSLVSSILLRDERHKFIVLSVKSWAALILYCVFEMTSRAITLLTKQF